MASTAETTPEMSPKDIVIDSRSSDEMQDVTFAQRGCCHWMPCFGSQQQPNTTSGTISWERITAAPPEKQESWWSKGLNALMKIREWSELVAGPRWKTFIRRFNKNRLGNGMRNNGKFQYDPLSYTLNFDEGPGQNGHFEDDHVIYRDFSSRYAAIPLSAKSSMDLGRDAPLFT